MDGGIKGFFKKGYQWPLFVIALVLINVVAVFFLVVLSSSSSTHAVEPNYYKKAVDWNATMAQQRQNMRLGWNVTVGFEPVTIKRDSRRIPKTPIVLSIRDRQGKVLRGVKVSLTAFAKLRSRRRYDLRPLERADGSHATALKLWPRGVWRFLVTAERGAERFTAQLERDAPPLLP